MSRFGAVESSALAQLQGVPGFAEVTAVAPGKLLASSPEEYPAARLSVLAARQFAPAETNVGHTALSYEIEFGVLIFASGDGITAGDARGSAWSLVDAVMDGFTNWQPTGLPALTSIWPAVPGDPQNVVTDQNLDAIYVPFTVKILYRV
jgi:hypothetical protein